MWFKFNNRNSDKSLDEQESENVKKSTVSDNKSTIKVFKNKDNDPIREKIKLMMRTVLPEKAYTSHDIDSIMFHDKGGKWYDAEDVDEVLDRLKYSLEWWEHKYLQDDDNTAIITGNISRISSKTADITNMSSNAKTDVVGDNENKPSTTTVKLNPFITRLG